MIQVLQLPSVTRVQHRQAVGHRARNLLAGETMSDLIRRNHFHKMGTEDAYAGLPSKVRRTKMGGLFHVNSDSQKHWTFSDKRTYFDAYGHQLLHDGQITEHDRYYFDGHYGGKPSLERQRQDYQKRNPTPLLAAIPAFGLLGIAAAGLTGLSVAKSKKWI